ncbi:MAG: hypothetical protein UX09_C0043G0005 [Candidatus Uhrbacteria bacterium GW2011_GWE2_45_35]|uniref:Uncharacterized protein n=2 Tax=Candidatus Uhriibacteriota TaxID=1752732 RepID=A0A0G1MDE9_9BACT|nr:MAG: hypothetical protein UW63_C0040G0005 [Candidatus Uhrbacteria bacterium GW2011_GWF2_44_350]KKU06738.1 MAG: hypothetical protein UX09_C0043G0005 [Candidatus Uhrbacteria bacterium GW2011_GWE2_45_35]HBR80733.1 hypothetical protein [Candidatus Uhrbacteria bacterium]HCU32002.1 hypothetical protein [Candidatus Uhrbacteria bacterium]
MEGQSRGPEMVAVTELKTAPEKKAAKDRELFELSPDEIVDRLKSMSSEERRKYLDRAFDDPRNLAMVSYYEKWLHKKVQLEVDEIAARKIEEKWGDSELPLGLETRLSPQDLKTLTHSLFFIQPTFGCSKACPFCALDAPGGVRSAIAPKKLENLFKLLPKKNQDTPNRRSVNLHYASEPSDYKVLDETTGKTHTFKDLFEMAREQNTGTTFITRDDDDDWLEFVKQSGAGRSLDNATADRLKKQAKKRGYAGVKIHEYGGREKTHKAGIGLSTKKTRELVGKKAGVYQRKPGSILTPRGVYNMFPGEIQPDAPIGAPQGVLAVPLGELRQGEKAFDILKPGVHLRKVMGHFLIEKMFDTDFFFDGEQNITSSKNTNACLAFSKQPSDEARLIIYSPKTYQIESVHLVTISPEEYQKKYEKMKRASWDLTIAPEDMESTKEGFLKTMPDKKKQIETLFVFLEITGSPEGKNFLTSLYKKFLEIETMMLFFDPQSINDTKVITLYFIRYLSQHPDFNPREKNQKEIKKIIEEAFPDFINSPFFEEINQIKKGWSEKFIFSKPLKKRK